MSITALHPSIVAVLISVGCSAFMSLVLVPILAARGAHGRQMRGYTSHVIDTIRDFRESCAVLSSITLQNYVAAYPISLHISKVGVADELLTPKVIAIGDLSEASRLKALWLTSILVNVNRDITTISELKAQDRRIAFDKAIIELADKLSNLSKKLLADHPGIVVPAPSSKPKLIHYEDGAVLEGVAYIVT